METMDNRKQEHSEQADSKDLFCSSLLDGWFTVHDGAYGQNEITLTLNTPI